VKNENGLSQGRVANKKHHDTFRTPSLFHKKPDADGFVVGRALMLIEELNSMELVNCTTPVPCALIWRLISASLPNVSKIGADPEAAPCSDKLFLLVGPAILTPDRVLVA